MVLVNLVAAGKQSDLLPGSLSRTCRPQRPAPLVWLAFLLPAILLAFLVVLSGGLVVRRRRVRGVRPPLRP